MLTYPVYLTALIGAVVDIPAARTNVKFFVIHGKLSAI